MKQYIVHIVVDNEFADKLYNLPFGEPAWVVDSPINKGVIKELWETRDVKNHPDGITSFIYNETYSPEQRFMSIWETVLLHHGEYSHDPPCSKINIIGVDLSEQIRDFLSKYNFTKYEITELGFTAEATGQSNI